MAVVARGLDDSDPRVVVQAAVLLRKVTGFDSGIRAVDALPNFVRSDDGTPPANPNFEAIQRGVRRWHEWWSTNRMGFSESGAWPRIDATMLPMKDFALENLDGQIIHLSDFRGKVVLLSFLKTGDPRSSDDLAALKQLQEQEGQRLAVLGVAFDPAVGPQDDCEGEVHGHGEPMMMNGLMMVMNASPGPIEPVVRSLVAREQIQFPVLLDKRGGLVFRCNVQEIPTYLLIDADGNLRRRFVGSRDLTAFEAMVDEAAPPTALSKLGR